MAICLRIDHMAPRMGDALAPRNGFPAVGGWIVRPESGSGSSRERPERGVAPPETSGATLRLMHVVDVAQAEARFAELLGRVQAGEEVLVTRANEPVARILPAVAQQRRPHFGAAKDLLHTRDDFDEPLEDFAPYTA